MTQAQREQRLRQSARDLDRLSYRNLRAQSLKAKHVEALIADWRQRGLSAGTVKNRMADVRWWAEKVGKAAAVARDNAHYGVRVQPTCACAPAAGPRSCTRVLPTETILKPEAGTLPPGLSRLSEERGEVR